MKFSPGNTVVEKSHPEIEWTVQRYTEDHKVRCLRIGIKNTQLKAIAKSFEEDEISCIAEGKKGE